MPADTQTLAASDEAGPAKNIEVCLLQFGKTDQAVDRAEAGAEVERTGALFLDDDIQILAARDHGVRRHGLDLREIVKVFETLAARVDQDRVIDVAGFDRQFAADHFVLGPRVALDVDEIEVGLRALVDAVGHVDQTPAGRRNLGNNEGIDVALRTVEFLQGLEVGAETVRSVERAVDHFQAAHQFIGRSDIDAIEAEAVDAVLDSFADGEDQFDAVAGERDNLDVGDLRIGETFILVGQTDGVLVFLQLGGHETPALVEEREKVLRLGLHGLAQVFGQHGVVAHEIDTLDHLFETLVDLENDTRIAGAVIGVDAGGDVHAAEVAVLVKLDHGLARFLHLLFAEPVADFEGQFFAQAVGRNFHRSLDENLADHGAALDENDHLHSVALRLGENADIVDIAGGEQ